MNTRIKANFKAYEPRKERMVLSAMIILSLGVCAIVSANNRIEKELHLVQSEYQKTQMEYQLVKNKNEMMHLEFQIAIAEQQRLSQRGEVKWSKENQELIDWIVSEAQKGE